MIQHGIPKICYILPEFDPETGSHFFHLYKFLERAASVADVYVIAEKGVVPQGRTPFGFYIQKFSLPPLRVAELFLLLCIKRFAGYKSFYTHYSFAGAASSWFVSKIFGGVSMYWNCGMPWLYTRSSVEEALFRFALKHSVFVTGTAGLRDEYLRRYGITGGSARVISNWIDVRRFGAIADKGELRRRLGVAKTARVVLFAHRLSRRKGSHQILTIAEGVTKSIPDAIFFIIGDGPDKKDIESAIAGRRLEKSVYIVGEVPNRDIHKYFGAADVFFMPSEEEGFPHVLLEAMAAGIPYVASDIGGVREITPPELRDYMVNASDPELFSKRIIQLLELSPADSDKLRIAEKRWVTQYDIEAVLPKFMSLFA